MLYTITKVAALIGARVVGGAPQAAVRWILTDSRSLCFPEETLFFAIRTRSGDGHQYIAELYGRGVRAFVVDEAPDDAEAAYAGAAFLCVSDTTVALQRLAERHRDEFDIPIVGITGSNGKTMVKEWLYQLLSPARVVTRSPRSYNSQIGVPLSVWLLGDDSQIGLFEAGISKPGEMRALHDIIRPTLGILTSLGPAHQENFRSAEEKCREKLSLFHDAAAVVYPSDDDTVGRCVRVSGFRGERIGWSRKDANAAMYVESATPADGRTDIHYIYKGEPADYSLPFIDEASVVCSIEAAAAARYLGVDAAAVAESMARLEPVAMRLEVKEGQRGCTIVNDTYNSDVSSLAIALDYLCRRPESEDKSRTVVLSDILQSGEDPRELYTRVDELLDRRGIAKLIGIGPDMMEQAEVFNVPEAYFFSTTDDFLAGYDFGDMRDEIVLVKGARAFGFDRISEALERKVHETILEVNLSALIANLNHYRAMLRPGVKLACMVKADAYGAGAIEVAKTLQDHRVDYLAVAVADEGAALRSSGITANIMIMNPEMTAFTTMFRHHLEPEVYSFRLLEALIRAAEKQGITGWPVHIKLDTGMHRLGFDPERDIDRLIDRLRRQDAVVPCSVFSHFVGSDSDDFDRFSLHQWELFQAGSSRLQAAFPHKIIRHICNSAGIEHFPERQMDMCRLGLGLYGIDSRDNHTINNVCTLRTTILQIHDVPQTETVGYSRKGRLTRDSRIAAIPIGYADGLDRHLGCGRGYCLVRGQKAPYVGNICMDVAMIDVTGIDCQEGDSVEIFGDNLPVTTLSDILGTIPYEVLTSVSGRVKKIYFQD